MGIIKELGEKVIDHTVSDKKEKFIIVDFSGEIKEYIEGEIEQLNLAWACTVHKYQGSQSKYIIFIMSEEAQVMMSRELTYTAFTRASKRLEIFGHENMLRVAPTRSIIGKRYTNTKQIIEELRSGIKVLDIMKKK
jgi:exodeoxyribonuclease V alpha subunit